MINDLEMQIRWILFRQSRNLFILMTSGKANGQTEKKNPGLLDEKPKRYIMRDWG